MIELTINGKNVSVPEGTTILEAAKTVGIHIPTLCHMELDTFGYMNKEANCRVCMVESMKDDKMVPACNTLVKKGMEIRTDTLRVIRSRRMNIELLLSNHPKDCLICSKNGQCELQSLAAMTHIRTVRVEGERIDFPLDNTSLSIVRDPNKCILCKRCETMCHEVQTVGTLTDIGRGFKTVVGTSYNRPMFDSNCTFCGQCLAVCPTGALSEVNNTGKVYQALQDPSKIVVVQTAPAVRVALGEAFELPAGTSVTGKMVAALKALHFDYVFDTDFAADLTTMEEAAEVVKRLNGEGRLPILTSCCPSWVRFIENNFPDLLDIPSTCKSPHEMFGSVVKTYFAEKNGLDPKNIVVVSVMPCVAKKYESSRPELSGEDNLSDVDIVITTRELAAMIKDFSIDFLALEDQPFDDPLGESTGAGVIFGASGGVLEAALRTAYHLVTGEDIQQLEFQSLKEMKGIKETQVDFPGRSLKVAVASGLGNARHLLEGIHCGDLDYDVIEIMACPGGCIDGAGQPFHHGKLERIEARMKAIHEEDRQKPLRRSYENPSIQRIYSEFLGEPGSEKAHELLHTSYNSHAERY